MNDERWSTTWPTFEEQQAVVAVGCSCRRISEDDRERPGEWIQDPYCGQHGDPMIMRATLRKAHKKIDRLRDSLENEWDGAT